MNSVYYIAVIQQLHEPNFTRFWPLWIDESGHFTYYVPTICHVTHHDLSIVAINWQYVCLPTLILAEGINKKGVQNYCCVFYCSVLIWEQQIETQSKRNQTKNSCRQIKYNSWCDIQQRNTVRNCGLPSTNLWKRRFESKEID